MPELMATLSENVAMFREVVNGQRAQFLTDGYSETAAEVMSIELWKAIVSMAFRVQA